MVIAVPTKVTGAESRDDVTAIHSVSAELPKAAQCIGVPREIFSGEKRVATVPEVVQAGQAGLFCCRRVGRR